MLGIANVAIALILLWQNQMDISSVYTDQWTVLLALVMAGVLHCVLWYERRRRNPLLIIIVVIILGFFLFRIVTLNIYSFSEVLSRSGCAPAAVNSAFCFIITATVALCLGIGAAARPGRIVLPLGQQRVGGVHRVIAFLFLSLLVMYLVDADSFWLISIIRSFFNQNLVLGVVITYLLATPHSLRTKSIVWSLVALEGVLHLLGGSRGSLYTIAVCYLCAHLAMFNRLQWTRSQALVTVTLVVLAFPIALVAFHQATSIRGSKTAATITLQDSSDIALESALRIGGIDFEDKVKPILDRLGFFDFSIDLIVNRERYKGVVTVTAHVKSIVDNLLTPGFDIFDQPRISNSLRNAYAGGELKKSQVAESYHTDQLGVFGELYVLFGYFGIVVIFTMGYAIQRAYQHDAGGSRLVLAIRRYTIITIFYNLINSYGVDWVVIDGVVLIVSVMITERFVLRDFHQPRVNLFDRPRQDRIGYSRSCIQT